MKKSNVIITVVLAVVSAFLLWLWYWLGFNEVDSPLDLVVSVVWWAVIAAGVVLVYRFEQKRRRQVRTVYLADGRYYNSEAGLRTVQAPLAAVDAIAVVLGALEYDFSKMDAPDQSKPEERVDWRYVIHTDKFKPARTDDNGNRENETWEGDVVTVATGDTRTFASREELEKLIA